MKTQPNPIYQEPKQKNNNGETKTTFEPPKSQSMVDSKDEAPRSRSNFDEISRSDMVVTSGGTSEKTHSRHSKSTTQAPTAEAYGNVTDKLAILEEKIDSLGSITDISKFIIQKEERQSIAKTVSTDPQKVNANIITREDAETLRIAFTNLGTEHNIMGCAILSHDGLLVYSTFPDNFDAETSAIRAMGIYMGADDIGERLGYPGLRQLVLHTESGHLIIAFFPAGLCMVMTEGTDSSHTHRLIERIQKLTRPS